MSAPKRTVEFSPRALRDYDDILLVSLTTWGEQQRDAYQALLDRALEEIGQFPGIGQSREDIGAGCRSLRVGQHILIYRSDGAAIRVNRILHSRQDLFSEWHVPGAE
ncbi:MAG: type II toxin-antitoxin system RelE/ParE family toxin [Thermomicrobiales bacterium]